MTITERISRLRQLMADRKWDVAVISGSDPHGSEYLAPRWQTRKWISGFTGSAGTVVVTAAKAGLWTDSRYFIQAAEELKGSGIDLHKLGLPETKDYVSWITDEFAGQTGWTVAIDGAATSHATAISVKESIAVHGGMLTNAPDYISAIWEGRPDIPGNRSTLLSDKVTGRSRADKLEFIRNAALPDDRGHILVTSLDDIAWITNTRGTDIDFNPLTISYLLIGKDNASMFVKDGHFTDRDADILKEEGICLMPYEDISTAIRAAASAGGRIRIDSSVLNHDLYCTVAEAYGKERITDAKSPVQLEKSIKNNTEAEGMRKAAVMDGVALTRFFIWLEKKMSKVRKGECHVTETQAAARLLEFRLEAGATGESFSTISAYGANAALPHYSAEEGKESHLEPHGLYLIDSGGQYPYGTTDVTRTIPLGRVSKAEREDYTLALKGMIALSMARFPQGTRGTNLDVLARNAMWMKRKNFGHGTGHGVGHMLCVHEGPQAIRHNWVDCPLMPGMITSNEPGLYIEGSHGIRHENLVLCREAGKNSFGTWLEFETITYVPICTKAVDFRLMTDEETKWLKSYNRMVYHKLRKYLDKKEEAWLKKYCTC